MKHRLDSIAIFESNFLMVFLAFDINAFLCYSKIQTKQENSSYSISNVNILIPAGNGKIAFLKR